MLFIVYFFFYAGPISSITAARFIIWIIFFRDLISLNVRTATDRMCKDDCVCDENIAALSAMCTYTNTRSDAGHGSRPWRATSAICYSVYVHMRAYGSRKQHQAVVSKDRLINKCLFKGQQSFCPISSGLSSMKVQHNVSSYIYIYIYLEHLKRAHTKNLHEDILTKFRWDDIQ